MQWLQKIKFTNINYEIKMIYMCVDQHYNIYIVYWDTSVHCSMYHFSTTYWFQWITTKVPVSPG